MKIYDDHNEVVISTANRGKERFTKKAALISLVKNHGLTENMAREMLGQAERARAKVFRIKYAQPFGGMLQPGPTAPAFPEPQFGMEQMGPNSVQSIYPQEEFLDIPGMDSSMTDPSVYDIWNMPDQNAMATAQQAGQSGQKEVFDTAMISGMLKTVRQDSLVDRYLGALMKALDKLGRILFLFYWHQEEFEDRYGKSDLPELEDSIRNSFESLGELTLFLKSREVQPAYESSADPEIEEAARN